jgi:cytochrome c peroxidase
MPTESPFTPETNAPMAASNPNFQLPLIDPGKGDGRDTSYWQTTGQCAFLEDFGRGRVTRKAEDNCRFRTPSLRNVAQTGP